MFDKLMKLIDSAEGLTVDLKIGKESTLTIKGDFMAMAKLAVAMGQESDKESDKNHRIIALEDELRNLKR